MADDVPDRQVTYAYAANNELQSMTDYNGTTSYAYDEWGRMTSRAWLSFSETYEYGYGSKMTKVTRNIAFATETTEYMYGAAGKRRWRSVDGVFDRGYDWDVGFNVISEHNSSNVVQKTYVTAPKPVGAASPGSAMAGILVTQGPVGTILAEITGSNPAAGSVRYYTQDNIQSTRGVFNGAAASLGTFEYTPFGSAYTPGGPADVTHRYTGLDLDPRTGQYYAPYRYYDPTTARWLTRDPLGMVDGPNVYGYLVAKLLINVDPLGLIGNPLSDHDCFWPCVWWMNGCELGLASCLSLAITCLITTGGNVPLCGLLVPCALMLIGSLLFCLYKCKSRRKWDECKTCNSSLLS